MIKRTFAALALSLASTGAVAAPVLVMQPIRQAFVPQGFDSNDDVQLVISGSLDDTCKKIAHVQVIALPEGRGFQVIQWVRKFDTLCLPMSTPFFTEVTLGRLPAGEHVIKSHGIADMTVSVTEAPSSDTDDFLYAPVHRAAVMRSNGLVYRATLTGALPNDCFSWKEVKLLDQGDVLVVLPILTYEDSGSCSADSVPFEKEIELLDTLEIGYHLLHVRSMSGKAVNATFFADGD